MNLDKNGNVVREEGQVWHKWEGAYSPEEPHTWQHGLCLMPKKSAEGLDLSARHVVTTESDEVDCKECLEWLHA